MYIIYRSWAVDVMSSSAASVSVVLFVMINTK